VAGSEEPLRARRLVLLGCRGAGLVEDPLGEPPLGAAQDPGQRGRADADRRRQLAEGHPARDLEAALAQGDGQDLALALREQVLDRVLGGLALAERLEHRLAALGGQRLEQPVDLRAGPVDAEPGLTVGLEDDVVQLDRVQRRVLEPRAMLQAGDQEAVAALGPPQRCGSHAPLDPLGQVASALVAGPDEQPAALAGGERLDVHRRRRCLEA
jgi:hypothetical protein